MRKTLALVFVLATAFGGFIRSQSVTPALAQSGAQSEGEKRLLNMLALAPEPCAQVSFIERVSPPAHMAWFLGTERIKHASEFVIANDGLELRKNVALQVRAQLKPLNIDLYAQNRPKPDAAPALKILDSVINNFRDSADTNTEGLEPIKKAEIVKARKAVLASMRERLREQITAAYAKSDFDTTPAQKALDAELVSIEQERGKLRADTAQKCAEINTSLRRPDIH